MPKGLPNPMFRTKKGNREVVLAGVDGRSLLARRFREITAQIEADMGVEPSEAQRHLIARAATLAVWAEDRESELARGEDFNATEYATISNALRRLLTDIGLKRVPRDATDLTEYLRERDA